MNRPFSIPVALPRGPEHYWAAMRAYGSKGFTAHDIACCSEGIAYSTVKTYLAHLLKIGAIKVVSSEKLRATRTTRVYAVAIKATKAPVQRRADYSGARGRVQQQLWTAMRSLGAFAIRELAAAASTDDLVIKPRTAEEYVRRLTRAGVLMVVEPYAKGKPGATGARAGLWRLKKSADTGPLAPKIFKASIVFDCNRSAIIGESEVSS